MSTRRLTPFWKQNGGELLRREIHTDNENELDDVNATPIDLFRIDRLCGILIVIFIF